jgi:hypothetical protein
VEMVTPSRPVQVVEVFVLFRLYCYEDPAP